MNGDNGSIVHGRMYENGPFYPRQYVPPGCEPLVDATPLTDEQFEELKAEWRRKYNAREIRLLTPLPRRVRLRLAVSQAVTDAGVWLCDHRMWWAADLLWWRR